MNDIPKIRPPTVAGFFYPREKLELEREIAIYLENAPKIKIPGRIIGLIAPHAGYMYSAGVAARAYRQIIDQEPQVVAVISPSHHEYFTEISVYDGHAYSTPLGIIPVDTELAMALADINPQFILSEKGHRFDEHALEVQLPLLQEVLNDFKLLPIVLGEHSYDNVITLAEGLATVLKERNALIVASSDLSHFYDARKARLLDNLVIENIKKFDEDKLFDDLQSGKCEMCGGGPVVAAMKACKLLGANKSEFLIYRNSGDISGNMQEVVGYLSALFYQH